MTVSGDGGLKGLLSLHDTAERCKSLGMEKMGWFKMALPLPPIASASAWAATGHVMGICNVRKSHTVSLVSAQSYHHENDQRRTAYAARCEGTWYVCIRDIERMIVETVYEILDAVFDVDWVLSFARRQWAHVRTNLD